MNQQNPEATKPQQVQAPVAQASVKRYEPPVIVTHSAEALKKQGLTVNACTSLIP